MRVAIILSIICIAAVTMAFTKGKIPQDLPDPDIGLKGHPREMTETYYDNLLHESGQLHWVSSTTTFFDTSGRISEIKGYAQSGVLLYADTPSYDEFGNRLGLKYYRGKVLGQEYTFSYDSLGRKTGVTSYNHRSKGVPKRTIYKYNDNGFCFLRESHKLKQSLESDYFRWDNRGNCIMDSMDEWMGAKVVHMYRYDEKDMLTSDTFYRNDTIQWNYIFHYDIHGNLLDREKHLPSGGIDSFEACTYQYKYDKEGNWTERNLLYKGVADISQVRKITYYK